MKIIKKALRTFAAAAILFGMLCTEESVLFCLAETTGKPQLLSESYVLIEASTGTVLHEKDMHKVLPPASITKVMTLLLIYEAMEEGTITMDTIVTASDHAASMGGSQVYLEPGEEQTVETMIKCISISSANDACVAMAEHISGTEEAFVAEMNKKAKELGMEHTNFVNSCGLDVEGHVSTAYDIALMSKELMTKYPEVTRFTTTRIDSMIHRTNKGESEFGLTNTNKLLQSYEGITGLKTGSTSKARYCLTATATRNNIDMIAVVLAAPDTKTRFREAATLLNYGFSQCKIYVDDHSDMAPVNVAVENSMDQSAELAPAEPFTYVTVNKEDLSRITEEILVFDTVTAPVKEGDELGTIIYRMGEKEIGRIPLLSKSDIEEATFKDYLKNILKLLT